ncbi:MAG: hypothetical protein E7474_04890 [Ruminococcaceae bacterium]|nr:hypothetical protein [Oscillospiraceae bacterium]
MIFGKKNPGAATLVFHSFDGGGPAYTIVMDSDIVSRTSAHKYAKKNHAELEGAGYDVIFTFTGLKPGKADMTVEERSPIGDNLDHRYTVTVDPDLNVSIEPVE